VAAQAEPDADAAEATPSPTGDEPALDQPSLLAAGLTERQLPRGKSEVKSEEGSPADDVTKETASHKPALAEAQSLEFEATATDSRDQPGKSAEGVTLQDAFPVSTPPPSAAADPAAAANAPPEAKPAATEPARPNPQPSAIDSASGAAPRSRLPAAALVHEPAAPRGALHIDAARLLNRVTRAFAAAQQQGGEIQLRLSPPELGSLRLVVQIEDRALVAHMEAETPAARTALIDNLPVLRERLAEQGVRIHRFDVDLMQRQPGDQTGGMSQQPQDRQRPVLPPRMAAPQAAAPAAGRTRLMPASPGGLNVIV
jgi:flagellar hook-length control protein FliK